MKYLLSLLFYFGMASVAVAQEGLFRGFIKASEDLDPLQNVQVKDLNTGRSVHSDASGYFEISVKAGNTLELSSLQAASQKIVIDMKMFAAIQQIVIRNKVTELPEAVVTGKTPYQIDSIERYERYRIPLSHKKDTAKVLISPIGLIIDNPVSSWMQYIAPKTKMKLKFQKNFQQWEEEKYIASKYDSAVVKKITGLNNDSLAWFMNAFPLSYEMARLSNAEGIEYWIRANYHDWRAYPEGFINKMIRNDREDNMN